MLPGRIVCKAPVKACSSPSQAAYVGHPPACGVLEPADAGVLKVAPQASAIGSESA
jgi:hypothetical protein